MGALLHRLLRNALKLTKTFKTLKIMAILKLQQGKQSGDRSPTTNIIGKIFKGSPKIKAKSGNMTVGKNLDYFRFVAKGRSAERVQELWDQFYATPNGGEPREITISFPYENIEWNLNEWYCEFGASGLKTQCNGVQIVGWRDKNNVFQTENPKPCRAPNSVKGCDACKASDLLKFKIFELENYGYDGIVELTTGSIHDISYLRDRLTEIQQTLASINLPLRGTPLLLYRETRTITKTINGISSRGEESLLGLSIHPSLQTELNKAMKRRLYAIVEAVGTASIPIGGRIEHQVLGSAEPKPAIAPANSSNPTDGQISIKELFKKMLADNGVDLNFNGNGAFIGKELSKMGYRQANGKGDASQIPEDKLEEVVGKVVKALITHNNLNLQPAIATEAEIIPEVATDLKKPIKSAFDPNEADQYLEAIATQ